ncbi:IPExxxVDY family protein [Flavobacterium sp.]|uniref:IPExxxVDY family protein n=1 Tax=Flavobacterium sp. TaxID=239 RepID=UPI00286E31AD|nr:IPExxxVDY family protein [Flavobacterium sp.]
MAIHKLHLEDFDEIDYNLIAIYSSLEDYKLAFKLNQNLDILLSKNSIEIPIEVQEKVAYFSRFTFEDEEKMMVWDLIQNKQEIQLPVQTSTVNLFENKNITRRVALVSELKKVDYFLKIEYNSQCKITDIVDNINKIDSISAVYEINTDKIKSKNNLIF